MSDEIDPVEEVRAVEHARTVGESFMRERLQTDSNRRVIMCYHAKSDSRTRECIYA